MDERVGVDGVVRDGRAARAGVGEQDLRLTEVGRGLDRGGEAGREFAERAVLAAVLDQAERRQVEERRRASVAEHDLVAVGQPEQLGEALPHPSDDLAHAGAAVRGPEVARRDRGERGEPGGADLGRSRAEPAVGGEHRSRDLGRGHGTFLSWLVRFWRRCRFAADCASMTAMSAGPQFAPGDSPVGAASRVADSPPGVSRRIAGVEASATLVIDAKAKALQEAGIDVISFGAGEPDFPTPAAIVEAAVAACRDPKSHHYTPTAGLPALREAIAAKTRRDSGFEVTAAQVLVTNGAKHALANAFADPPRPG